MKKQFLIGLLVILGITLTGCKHIDDTNGDVYDLETFTEEDLLGVTISMVGSGASITSSRHNFTTLGIYADLDFDYFKMDGGKYSGIKNLLVVELKVGESATYEVKSMVESGNLALVFIDPNRELIKQIAVNTSDTLIITALIDGVYFLRMGAESFVGSMEATRTLNK
jgi:hypothetical protein